MKLTRPPALIVFDFDGVFTDNMVYIDEDGKEMVCCSRADSLGIAMLRERGIPMCILSTETNPVVATRARKLSLHVFQGCCDKKRFLESHLKDNEIDPGQVIYVGNDLNDLEAMAIVGISSCPADAHEVVKAKATLVLSHEGGNGAVRELCELILETFDIL